MSAKLRVLAFVNHVPPSMDHSEALDRAFEWGVDIVIAQGNGGDFGPSLLGLGEGFPVRNFVSNIAPYVDRCHKHGVPFVLSCGIAGANAHLDACVDGFDALCAERGYDMNVAVISGEVDKSYLRERILSGTQIRRVVDHDAQPELLRVEDVDDSIRIVAQMGPEPIMAALEAGVDGVLTGRALDVGLFMAPALNAGATKATAAHFGKILECGGLTLSPGDAGAPVYGEVDGDEIIIRSPDSRFKMKKQSVAAHTFYERRDPHREENPGGWLDLTDVEYDQVDDSTVRARGAKWGDTPYSVKLEGSARIGHRAINVAGIRDPRFLGVLDETIERIKADVRTAPRFADLKERTDYFLTFTVYGRDAVLGAAETERDREHEVGVVIDAIAPTRDLARELCYFAYIGLWIKPYPGRKTTAGNNAQRFSPPLIDAGDAFRWSVWHLLPLEDAHEPFNRKMTRFPRAVASVGAG